MSKSVERIVLACAKELDALDADWAIGGAAAMAVHGYERATKDIDLFIGDDVREELLDRLRARALPILAAMPPIHYALVPNPRRPDERVDLLFPALGVEVGDEGGEAHATLREIAARLASGPHRRAQARHRSKVGSGPRA